MGDWTLGLDTLSEASLSRLAQLLDNSTCGWRQLASLTTELPQFSCSEKELTSCSLQALLPSGSPARHLLTRLSERRVPLSLLLRCLDRMDHRDAAHHLTTTVAEQVCVVEQPQAQQGAEGGRVVLTCRASGPIRLDYQWFRGKEEIFGGCGPELVLCPLTSAHQGAYICRVNHGERCVFSHWARVSLLRPKDPSPGAVGTVLSSGSVLCVLQQPQDQSLSEGEELRLACLARANPPAQYQWYHNQEPLPRALTHTLRIPCVTTADRGQYSCRVFNLYHEVWSDKVNVSIGPSSLSHASWAEVDHGFDPMPSPARQRTTFYATDKVALLLGNMSYQHHRRLRAPMADVHQLASQLRQLDFKVVSLLDLSWTEMHSAVLEFLLLLDRGVYGLLYFAGHGYENYGSSFMVPIDAPASYTSEHCLCVQDVLSRMQDRDTGLNVFLLDMCRKRNLNDDIIQQPGLLKVTANIVFGYATCVDAEAFEVNRDDLSNGIFISFLKQRLLEDEKVTVMLDRVAEDMGGCVMTRGRQALELRSNLSERRSLTDAVRPCQGSAQSHARNLQWAIAHVLPERRSLRFDCGVTVRLGFAAEFSNIMIIYTQILDQPSDITSCSAHLTDLPESLDIDMKQSNQSSLEETGSLLLTTPSLPAPAPAPPSLYTPSLYTPSLYTRLGGLQRLKTELSFSVCLQYRYSHLDEEVQETQTVSVGKPLVSKLNLHEPRPPSSSSSSSCSSSSVHHPSSLPSSSSSSSSSSCSGPSLPASETSSIGSASTSWSYQGQSGGGGGGDHTGPASSRVGQPEETGGPDWLGCDDAPQPLSSSLPPHAHADDLTCKFSRMYPFHSC